MLFMIASTLPVKYHAALLPPMMMGVIFLSAFFWTEIPRNCREQLERLPPLILQVTKV